MKHVLISMMTVVLLLQVRSLMLMIRIQKYLYEDITAKGIR